MLLIYKDFIFYFEPTLNQQIAILNQQRKTELFHWLAVNQQIDALNQQKIAGVGSVKSSSGAAYRAVNQLNQLNQHYFCLLSEKIRDEAKER